ncbi:class I SAM-dependent methyltransferase [Nitratireductor mangrovi]|uniref:Class I SAM-dependent methyltransferase n=1 Tax=Nitratireductor mangrovi TaxID=2599600 RepID=A0A5B8KZ53_9HYPH|nr:cyclopropane-fatty-acyl-phospholipid synthase family protein [Nitratireductor mangrovi]QDZ01024.1 class I SAM-dependent methyltransferase [Nitratireductor mangrovi]
MNMLLRSVIERLIRTGNLTVIDPGGAAHAFGDQNGRKVTVAIRTRHAERAITVDPTLALPEAYMNGEIDMVEGDLLDLLEIVYTNTGMVNAGAFWARMADGMRYLFRRFQQLNTTARARQNVRRHYDLSRELYRLFLDEDLQYSCAYFTRPDMTLEEAQLAKKRHLAAKLAIKPGQTVLDIGCGFGGLSLYLTRNFDADVLGITLSEEQLAIANERAQEEGLEGHVHFELKDYRKLSERFDRIVSVGMFEHVGVNHYRTFFDKCATILKPDGVMVLHSIGRSGPPAATTPFIRKHIFPGGYIPALSEVLPAIERSGLMVSDIEILRLHYADTLKHWRQRFLANRDRIRDIYDERFCRMWEFYLAGSEAGFRWQDLMVFQIQLTRKNTTLPVTRDYMGAVEERLARQDAPDRGTKPQAPAKPGRRRKRTA